MGPQKPPGHGMRFGRVIREAIPKKAKSPKRRIINPRRKKGRGGHS